MKWEIVDEIPSGKKSQYDEIIDLTLENGKLRLSDLDVEPKRFVSGLYSRCNTRGIAGKIGCRTTDTEVYVFVKE